MHVHNAENKVTTRPALTCKRICISMQANQCVQSNMRTHGTWHEQNDEWSSASPGFTRDLICWPIRLPVYDSSLDSCQPVTSGCVLESASF